MSTLISRRERNEASNAAVAGYLMSAFAALYAAAFPGAELLITGDVSSDTVLPVVAGLSVLVGSEFFARKNRKIVDTYYAQRAG